MGLMLVRLYRGKVSGKYLSFGWLERLVEYGKRMGEKIMAGDEEVEIWIVIKALLIEDSDEYGVRY